MDLSPLAQLPAPFAQIMGLVVAFVGQRRAGSALSYQEFTAWLAENRHYEIIKLLEQNATTATSIKALLSQDRQALHQRFDAIDRSLAVIAGGMKEFGALAAAMRPDAVLSEDAIKFLRFFDQCGSERVLVVVSSYGMYAIRPMMPQRLGQIPRDYDAWRFFEDDIRALVNAHLLNCEQQAEQHKRILILTRAASEFVRSLPDESVPAAAASSG